MNSKHLKELTRALCEIDDYKEMKNFLLGLFTLSELEEIPMRLQIVKMLKAGMPQREIAEKLGVGIGTVTRGSMEIKRGRFKSIK